MPFSNQLIGPRRGMPSRGGYPARSSSRGYGGQKRSSPKVWFCPLGALTNIANLGAGAQATVVDQPLTNPITNQAYDPGTIVGLRLSLDVDQVVAQGVPAEFVVMVLPNGLAVPSILSHAQKKNAELYIWAAGLLDFSTNQVAANVFAQTLRLHLKTGRKFQMNDRIVVVLVNPTVTAWAAGALGEYYLDGYVVNQA